MVLLTETSGVSTCGPHKGWILDALNLQSLEEWPEAEQEQARELLPKGAPICPQQPGSGQNICDQGPDQVDGSDTLQGALPIYMSHMYDDVRAHFQEMLNIGAIRKVHSLLASIVVLVWKKDRSLRFCIDLRKLNSWAIKDAYSLPHIDETLHNLQGSQWFSSLDLKSGYWQVKMDEESKPLTAFTIGSLGFYRCDWIPFRLTNAPATFQQLMETCLGDLNVN